MSGESYCKCWLWLLNYDLTMMSTGCNHLCANINLVLCHCLAICLMEIQWSPNVASLFLSNNIFGALIQFVDTFLLSCSPQLLFLSPISSFKREVGVLALEALSMDRAPLWDVAQLSYLKTVSWENTKLYSLYWG